MIQACEAWITRALSTPPPKVRLVATSVGDRLFCRTGAFILFCGWFACAETSAICKSLSHPLPPQQKSKQAQKLKSNQVEQGAWRMSQQPLNQKVTDAKQKVVDTSGNPTHPPRSQGCESDKRAGAANPTPQPQPAPPKVPRGAGDAQSAVPRRQDGLVGASGYPLKLRLPV